MEICEHAVLACGMRNSLLSLNAAGFKVGATFELGDLYHYAREERGALIDFPQANEFVDKFRNCTHLIWRGNTQLSPVKSSIHQCKAEKSSWLTEPGQ